MTFAELVCTDDDFQPFLSLLQRGITKGKFGDAAEASEILYATAKQELLSDLQTALGLNPQNENAITIIDAIVDSQQLKMRRALALKQTEIALFLLVRNTESILYEKYRVARDGYRAERSGFSGLRYNVGNANVSILDVG